MASTSRGGNPAVKRMLRGAGCGAPGKVVDHIRQRPNRRYLSKHLVLEPKNRHLQQGINCDAETSCLTVNQRHSSAMPIFKKIISTPAAAKCTEFGPR